jgi:serine/threonine protein kinase
LNHPNIVVAHDADDADGIPYMAMEFIEGSDLGSYVKTQGPLSPAQAVKLIIQAARALEYAHRCGVVHRDVKPQNLMLDTCGNLKILDLGLARFDQATTEGSAMTQSGVVMGTIDYVAPEQALNARTADGRADVYALGCTLHFLLTGRPPYVGETPVERLIAHRESPIPSLRTARADLPEQLDAIFCRSIAKTPEARYQTMAEMAQDLEALAAGTLSNDVFEPAPPPIAMQPPPLESTSNGTEFDLFADTDLSMLARFEATQPTVTLAPTPPRLPSKKRRQRPKIPPKVWTWVIAAASSIAFILLLAVIGSAVTSGGGQALIVVSPDGFSSADYSAVTGALKSRGIKYATASTTSGYARSDRNERVPIDITLQNASKKKYQAVIFCGDKHGKLRGQSDFIKSSLEKGSVVTGVGGGFYTGVDHVCHEQAKQGKGWENKGGYEVMHTQAGKIVKVCESKGADKALGHVFNKLAKE